MRIICIVFILFVHTALYSELTSSNTLVFNPPEAPRPESPSFLALCFNSGVQSVITNGGGWEWSYLGSFSVECSLPHTPFGLKAAIALAPDIGLDLGCRFYFSGPFGFFIGADAALMFSYLRQNGVYGTGGLEAGFRFPLLPGKVHEGLILETRAALAGDIMNFYNSDPGITNINGFGISDIRPSLNIGLGYMFY